MTSPWRCPAQAGGCMLTPLQAAESHLHCVLRGIGAAMRGENVELMLGAALHQAHCCMDVLRRAQAATAHDDDVAATRAKLLQDKQQLTGDNA